MTLCPWALEAGKIADDERLLLMRGLLAEFGTAKIVVPRSKKALTITAQSGVDRDQWAASMRDEGPCARTGDLVQITKVDIDDDKVTLQINGGYKGGRKWYENVQVGAGTGNSTRTVPIGNNRRGGPAGTSVVVHFPKEFESITVAEVKKWLSPAIDFEKQRSATENYVEQMKPEVQQAIKEQRPLEGMDKEQVIMAMGRPRGKSRETKDGVELEDWVYGQPPGKITFVTFDGDKVVKIKESFAGLGGATGPSLKPR
ncbi:MAG: DUF2845 domain-containing protein [Bryobacteraceae bacterium]|nr:DUF2845 domain-containing protein [Bryobacteraceae bacterium]